MKTLYKILINGRSCHGGELAWSLPQGDKPGDWHALQDGVEPRFCKVGFHLTSEPHNWYKWGCDCYEAEGRGLVDEQTAPHKACYREVRLLRKVAHPQWWLDAIEFVGSLKGIPWLTPQGEPDAAWLVYDTRAAAGAAAGDEAWDAARAAAGAEALAAARDAARTEALAAARDAAGDAARDEARAAAIDAAWDAAIDAAGAAARDEAWDAARAAAEAEAWDVAGAAAEAAAWAAARAAAGDAALMAICLVALPHYNPTSIYAQKRMEVWRRGFGLACDVGGKFYVYRKP